jgi:hypothetical protein
MLEIDLSHRVFLTEKFQALKLDIAEYSFANIYLFRATHNYQLLNELFIKGKRRNGTSFLMPIFPIGTSSLEEMHKWLAEADCLFPIPEQWLTHFDPNVFDFITTEDESDYLLELQRMRTYAGRHLSGKRNLVKQLFEHYRVETAPLTPEKVSDASIVLNMWQENQALDIAQNDFLPCKEALSLLDLLQLTGLIFYVDEQPVGFILGEVSPSGHFLVHFVKGNKSIKGLYQYFYQALANAIPSTCSYLNLEQDLGIAQVRQAKRSYKPDRIIPKWQVQFKTAPK